MTRRLTTFGADDAMDLVAQRDVRVSNGQYRVGK
jgi:hypothetical protein